MNGYYNFDPMTGAPIAPQGQPIPQGQPVPPHGAPYAPYPAAPEAPFPAPSAFPQAAPIPAGPQAAPQTAKIRRARPKRVYTAKETALAWVSAFVGYFFCRTFFIWEKPVTALAFSLCLFAFAFVFFGKQKRNRRSYFYPASAIVLSSSLFFAASPIIQFFVFAYVCSAFVLFCQTGSDAALEGVAGALYFFEAIKAFFVSPFKSIGATVGAIGANKGGKKIGRVLLMILIGVGVAFIPTLIVLELLSFDNSFTDILERIWETILEGIFPHFWSLVFGIPIGMYVYAALYTSAHGAPDGFNAENCARIEEKMKIAPSLLGAAALAPMLFLYGVFIAAQSDYYKAIFTSTLPDAYTFAEFARDGFFRLCVVAAINAAVLIALRVFTKRAQSGKISPVVKVCTIILSLVTIVISLTAISQMIMYVSAYGLTRMRLYALWFMALLILLFVVAILKQLVEKLPFAATCVALCVVCFALLAIPDADAIIAEHNYDCYVEGTTDKIDVQYLEELGPSAIPTLCRLVTTDGVDEFTRREALHYIGFFASEQNKVDVQGVNLPLIRARRAYDALDKETKDEAAAEYGRVLRAFEP